MRRSVALLALVSVLAGGSACTSGSPSAKVSPSGSAHAAAPAAATSAAVASSASPSAAPISVAGPVWDSVLGTISDDGTVSTATALQAFSLAFGPLPGVRLPAGKPGLLLDATGPLRMLIGHWQDITAAQRAAAAGLVPELASLDASGASPKALGDPPQVNVRDAGFQTKAKYQQRRTDAFYTELAQGYATAIGAKVGLTLTLPITAHVTGADTKAWAMETWVFSASKTTEGTPASCRIDIAANGDALDGEDVELALTHEVWHCFEGQVMGLVEFYRKTRMWLIEGQAEWVGQTQVPIATLYAQSFWPPYLNQPGRSLFARSYDAVGFYSQLAESGTDVWSVLIPMLVAKDNAAAFDASGANADAFLDRWASGYFRTQSRGAPWDIHTPAVTESSPDPSTLTAPPETSAAASAKPYTVALYTVNPVESDLERFAFSGNARVSDTAGHDYPVNQDSTFCVLPAGCTCPPGAQPPKPAPPLAGGPIDLGVTGNPSGNEGTVTGESLKDYCQTCPSSGTAIPAGTYSGPISGTFLEALHVSGPGQDGSGHASFTGNLTIRSDGTNVYGTIAAKGPGSAVIGQIITTNFFGGMTGNIYGSVTDPMSKGTLAGESDGTPTHSPYNASLHVTSASCASISGDMVAMLQEITKPVAQYLTLSGNGTWTIPRKN